MLSNNNVVTEKKKKRREHTPREVSVENDKHEPIKVHVNKYQFSSCGKAGM